MIDALNGWSIASGQLLFQASYCFRPVIASGQSLSRENRLSEIMPDEYCFDSIWLCPGNPITSPGSGILMDRVVVNVAALADDAQVTLTAQRQNDRSQLNSVLMIYTTLRFFFPSLEYSRA